MCFCLAHEIFFDTRTDESVAYPISRSALLCRRKILLSVLQSGGILSPMRILSANRTVLALGMNAVLLLLILIAITTRDGRVLGQSVAYPTPAPAPTAPAVPLTVMPCQLSQNTWGCYVMDPQNQTLSVYQYLPHEELRLLAARDLEYDRRLKQYNTSPPPADIKAMLDRSDEPARAAPTTVRSPEMRYR